MTSISDSDLWTMQPDLPHSPIHGERQCRIALYSHDTMGIGHFRRNLMIAGALQRAPFRTSILIIAGAREAGLFAARSGIDSLTLPSVVKTEDGSYESGMQSVPFSQLIDLRARSIDAALSAFRPDVLIVDKVPRGVAGELDSALQSLKTHGETKFVLGLRDVLDDPDTVRREWHESGSAEAVSAFYDAIWIYGDRRVCRTLQGCGVSDETSRKTLYTGYIAPLGGETTRAAQDPSSRRSAGLPQAPYVLCVVGGGQDGAPLIDAVSQADLPSGMDAVLLPGPFIPPQTLDQLHDRAAGNPRLHVHDFVTDPERFIAHADRVIGMGGYNSICEVLAFRKPALVVPRIRPRQEQLIRAERLRDMNLIDMLHPDDVSPRAVSDWLNKDISSRPAAADRIDMQGQTKLPQLLATLLQESRPAYAAVSSELEDSRIVNQ